MINVYDQYLISLIGNKSEANDEKDRNMMKWYHFQFVIEKIHKLLYFPLRLITLQIHEPLLPLKRNLEINAIVV